MIYERNVNDACVKEYKARSDKVEEADDNFRRIDNIIWLS